MDVPADPYECERCRWDWRKRRFASFCGEHQRRANDLGNHFVARLSDLIPPAPQPEQPSAPPAPIHQTRTNPDRNPDTVKRRVDFDF